MTAWILTATLLLGIPVAPVAPTAPVPPTPPTAPLAPVAPRSPSASASPAASIGRLRGDWTSIPSGAKVAFDSDSSVDEAVLEIGKAAGWDSILDTSSDGDEELASEVASAPVEQALGAVLSGSPLVAYRFGNVVAVAPGLAPRHAGTLTGFSDASTDRRFTDSDKDTLDATLKRLGQAAGWNVILHTGATGDRLLVVRLHDVPVEQALRALLAGTRLSAHKDGALVSVSRAGAAPVARAARDTLVGFDPPSGKTFTGDFSATPVDQALRKLLDAAGLSVVLPQALDAKVTAHFQAAPLEDALRALCAQTKLRAVRQGSVVTIERAASPGLQLEFHSDDADADARDFVEAARDAEDEMRDAAGEAEPDLDADDHSLVKGRDRVGSGNQALNPGERVRDLVALRGSAELAPGSRAKEVTAIMGSVRLSPGARVDRDVTAILGDVHVSPGAQIGGGVTAVGGRVIVDPGGMVKGERTSIGLPALAGMAAAGVGLHDTFSPLLALGSLLARFALYFALGLVLLVFWPRRVERVALALLHTPARSTVVGMLALVALPVLTLLLIVTVVGIALLPFEGILLAAVSVLGFSALALLIGRKLPIRVGRGAAVAQLALGTALIVLATHLPLLGNLIAFVSWVVVGGAVLATRFGQGDTLPDGSFPHGP